VILAAALRFANLAALGYVNHYYTLEIFIAYRGDPSS
jgi:hypothetical protein